MSMQSRAVIPALSLLLITGCGGGGGSGSTVTIGGTVTGLVGKLVLQNNAGDNLSVTANEAFTFATALNKGATYAVTVLTQSPGPTCVVSNGSGAATVAVTNVSVTCTTDPATVFLPISATAVPPSTAPGATGLFVTSSKSPADPPIQITTDGIKWLGLQSQYTLSAQGTASAGNISALIYTTLNSSSGDHVWSLNLSGTSPLVPTQLSNLTIPYHTVPFKGGGVTPVQFCRSLVIPKNLADSGSAFLILALPTDATSLCDGSSSGFKWLLIHSSDGPTSDPVSLPALSGLALSATVLPLYRPDGALAGLVTTDASNNLDFYPDETFTNPHVLLANIASFTPRQEAPSVPIATISANPIYSFLLVQPSGVSSGRSAVYRIDYSGSISADLYDAQNSFNGLVVNSGNLYFTDTSTTSNASVESVGRIPSDGGSVQILGSATSAQGSWLPALQGISGSHLVFSASTPQQQWNIQTLPTDMPGTFTTIGSYNSGVPFVSIAGGDVFVSVIDISSSPDLRVAYSTQILDITGNVLQAYTPSSYFISSGAPIMQERDITGTTDLGGGGMYVVDLSQPSAPVPVALKTVTGSAFNLPSGTDSVYFKPVTPTISLAQHSSFTGGTPGPALVYDLTKGTIVPVSIPNSNIWFLTDAN
jgi:hypothetical protein